MLLLIDAVTKIPLAVKVGQMQEHEALWTRALVTQARLHVAGYARRHKVICDKGFVDGTTRWWLDQPGMRCVVPAKTNMAVRADARAQAAAGEDITVGRRVHTVRQGQTAWAERRETEVVGMTGLTTSDQYGTPAHGPQHKRRDFQANLLHAVVGRTWSGKDDGPGGNTGFLTHAPVQQPLQPLEAYDDRSLLENCGSTEAKQQWELGHPPQTHARAVRVHVVFTRLLCALATAYRLQGEHEARGGEPVGWQRWRRQLLEQTREQVMVFAQGSYGTFHVAEYSLRLGVKHNDVPPGIGTRQEVLAKYGLTTRG